MNSSGKALRRDSQVKVKTSTRFYCFQAGASPLLYLGPVSAPEVERVSVQFPENKSLVGQ